jgi:hypothetical protein
LSSPDADVGIRHSIAAPTILVSWVITISGS